jgi:hypothetical protein
MPDEANVEPAFDTPRSLTRRDSVRLAAAMALGAGLGVPSTALGLPQTAVRVQVKFYKAASDGGQLVGSVELMESVTSFIGSVAGARAQLKWYDWSGREVGTMGIPSMIQDKIMAAMRLLPPGE